MVIVSVVMLGGSIIPARAFIFGSWKDKGAADSGTESTGAASGAERAWLDASFAAAGSLFAVAAAECSDSADAAGYGLMSAASRYYAVSNPGLSLRSTAAERARALLGRYPESPFVPVASAVSGDIAFFEGRYADAAAAYPGETGNGEEFPAVIAAGIGLRAAYALLRGGEPLRAHAALTVLPADPVIGDYRVYWSGEAALKCDSTVNAILALENLLKKQPQTLVADEIRWLLGEAYVKYGSFAQAREIYKTLAGLKRLGTGRYRAQLYLGELHEKQGNADDASSLYLQVMRAVPETEWGWQARQRLFALYGVTGESLTGRGLYFDGRVLAGRGLFAKALAQFDRYLTLYPRSPIKGTVRLAAAKALFGMGTFSEAEDRFAAIRKTYRKGAVGAAAALYMARCRKEAGDMPGARDAYRAFQKSFPRHAKAAEALWYAAWAYEMDGDYDRAVPLYNRIAGRYRKDILGIESVWRSGYCYYKAGKYDKAISRFRKYGKSSSAARRDKSRYWMARARNATGDTAKGLANLRLAFEDYPRTYYSVRAAYSLDSVGFKQDIPGEFAPGFDAGAVLRQTAATVRGRHLHPAAVKKSGAALRAHPRYVKGMRLMALGFYPEGRAELIRVERAFKNDTAALLLLYDEYVRYGIYDRAYRTAYRALGRIHKADIDKFPLNELRLMFPPAYFEDVVAAYKRNGGVPYPYLTYAVMHRESSFNPDIVSPAGAVGLMQIMPGTGSAVAEADGMDGFTPERLTDPGTSIRLGAHYLADLAKRYDGNIPRMLAAYNAGPDEVDAWLRRNGRHDDTDCYVEELDFRETRTYVRKVMRSMRLYRELWDDYCRR